MDFLNQYLLDNQVKSLLTVFTIIGIVYLFKTFLSKVLINILQLFFKQLSTLKKDALQNLILKPFSWVVFTMVTVVALDKLTFPGYWQFKIYGIPTQDIFSAAARIAVILVLIRFFMRIVDYIVASLSLKTERFDKNDAQVINFLGNFLKVVIGIFGVIWLIQSGFNKDVSNVLTGLSIVGAAIALAAKESLENIIASFIIFFDKPFFVGDLLKVNGIQGVVESVGLRSTRIRTSDKTLVSIPNKQLVDSVVDNLSRRTYRRSILSLELNAKSSSKAVKEFVDYCKQVLYADKEIVSSYSVHISDINKSAIVVQIEFLTIPFSLNEHNDYKASLIMQMKQKMESLGLSFSAVSDIRIIQDEKDDSKQPPAAPTIV